MAKFQLNDFSKRKLRKLAALTSEMTVLQNGLSDRRTTKMIELQEMIRAKHQPIYPIGGPPWAEAARPDVRQEHLDQFNARAQSEADESAERISEIKIEIAELELRQAALNADSAPARALIERLLEFADRPHPEFDTKTSFQRVEG